ncbi:MAG: anthranilate phosphoribosyltransferase [Rickettsiales bacterium]
MSRRDDMAAQIGALLDGSVPPDAAISWLKTHELERISAEELTGAVDAVMARCVPFPEFPEALDCCGTGGDGLHTFNISTASAFVVAARGVMIAKHGNRAVTSKSGSADVLEALGVNTAVGPLRTAEILNEVGIAFLFAPVFHPGFANVAMARKAVGKRTIFNLLGPLCNPARVRRQLIGTFAPEYAALMAEAAQLLGRDQVMVVHGDDGTDELSITGITHVSQLQNGQISYAALRPQDAGLTPQPGIALTGGDAHQNAKALRDVLGGAPGPYADAVALNAAAVLMLAGRAQTLADGVTLARGTMARGAALEKLEQLIEASHA